MSLIKTYVNIETGETLELREGDKIIKKKQEEAIMKNKRNLELKNNMTLWNNQLGGFVFVIFKYCDEMISENIKQEDIVKLFYLATYVDYEGYIIYRNTRVKRKTVNQILNIHRNSFPLFFNKMIRLGILIQDDNKYIKISSDYFEKGEIAKEIKKYYNYTRLYINTIRYLYQNVPIYLHKGLGNYFKMIPYIHRQKNLLCHNPESPKEYINLMRVGELKKILNYTEDGVSKLIRSLLRIRLNDGSAIIGFFREDSDEAKSYIIINPKVFYGGNFDLSEGSIGVLKWF